MSNLKQELIKIGNTNPELRENIKEVLKVTDKKAASGYDLYYFLNKGMVAFMKQIQDVLTGKLSYLFEEVKIIPKEMQMTVRKRFEDGTVEILIIDFRLVGGDKVNVLFELMSNKTKVRHTFNQGVVPRTILDIILEMIYESENSNAGR